MEMKKEQILGIIRQLLTFLGSYFVAKGLGTDGLVEEIAGSIVALSATIWGLVDKSNRELSVWYSLARHLFSALGGVFSMFGVSNALFEQLGSTVLGLLSFLLSFLENRK